MHGIIKPTVTEEYTKRDRVFAAVRAWANRNRYLLILVFLPTMIVAAYEYLIAADQFQSEAHFIVRTAEQPATGAGGLSQLFGIGGGPTGVRADSLSVNDYLESQSAVAQLGRSLDLVTIFRRPEADFYSRLPDSSPTPEALLKYFKKQVDIHVDNDSGITTLKVRAFKPEDALGLVRRMLVLGEDRVNELNQRSQADSLESARKQLLEAEDSLADVQLRLTEFRKVKGDIDPEGSGRAQIGMIAQLQIAMTQAKAQLNAMNGFISSSSPQYLAQAAKVRALEAQVMAQTSAMTQGSKAVASRLGDYQDLQIRQEFAAKRYELAAANLERARLEARKQHLYVVRVVDPNLPQKSLYPERGKKVATVFFMLLIAYGIGWLITAGMRDHSA